MSRPPSMLGLLLRVHALASWRRLLDLRRQSKLLLAVIGSFLAGYLVLAFLLFRFGLAFVGRFPGLGSLLVERLVYILFALLLGLLLLSNVVIAHTNFFRNRETAFLLACPVPAGVLFRWKCIESTVLASWAFLFLVAPLLAAYGSLNHAPWHFYPAILALLLVFVAIPGVLGSALAVAIGRWLDRRTFQAAAVLLVGTVLVALAWQLRPEPASDDALETRVQTVVDRLLSRTGFAQSPALPSHWLATSVLELSEGATRAAGFHALVLLANALLLARLASRGLGGPMVAAMDAVQSRGPVLGRWGWWRRRAARRAAAGPDAAGTGTEGWMAPDALDRALRWAGLAPDVRALVAKDARLFWRDTAQWGQTVLLFGLLSVYILNLRHFTRQLDSPFWIGLVSYMNLGACALNVATITTRFVFPQFSLEGRRVWLVGMAPLGLVRVVALKFAMGSVVSVAATLALTLLSGALLGLDAARQLYFAAAVSVMAVTLNAIAAGLGAIHPNLRETNPSKIVSGFGGTFCLVLSFLYILASVVLLAVGSPWEWRGEGLAPGRGAASMAAFVLASLLVGGVPLRIGLRRVARVEL